MGSRILFLGFIFKQNIGLCINHYLSFVTRGSFISIVVEELRASDFVRFLEYRCEMSILNLILNTYLMHTYYIQWYIYIWGPVVPSARSANRYSNLGKLRIVFRIEGTDRFARQDHWLIPNLYKRPYTNDDTLFY